MANSKEILVVTTSTIEGVKVKEYLKPVSAHIVAGTNFISDFMGGFSDIFGGRSQSYQRQLTSLYNEATERIKLAAYEIGGNCVLNLSIDMDEISGKGKSMFMLTAIGTAVIIGREIKDSRPTINIGEKFKNVAVDKIDTLRQKKAILDKAFAGTLVMNENIWNFITSNQVHEIFDFLLKRFADSFTADSSVAGSSSSFYKFMITYVDALPEEKKLELLYRATETIQFGHVASKITEIIKELNLLDLKRTNQLLGNIDFNVQKRALKIATYDKPFYNKDDLSELQVIRDKINTIFIERGTKLMKKQLLSSKEKEVWICECGKTNDIDTYCTGCEKDIYGFKFNESKPKDIDQYIADKMVLITEYLE